MGWKSTLDLTRKQAIQAIIGALDKTPYDDMTNEELKRMMYELGIGDDENLPYYGHNFIIYNTQEDLDNSNFDLENNLNL